MKTVELDTAHFAAWLGTKPAGDTYKYRSSECATAQYFKAHGFRNVMVEYAVVSGTRRDGVRVTARLDDEVARALSLAAGSGYGDTTWGDAAKAVKRYA